MSIWRTTIVGGFLGCACCLAGCGAASFTGDGKSGSEDFWSTEMDDFARNRPLLVEADKTTSQSTTASLPGDLLQDAPDEAAIVLNPAGITVTVNGGSSGRKNPTAKATARPA